MSTIPIRTIVNVQPSVLSAGGNAASMGAVVLSKSTALAAGVPSTFYDAASVLTFFSAGPEADIAAVYFNGFENSTATPAKITFFQAVEAGGGFGLG